VFYSLGNLGGKLSESTAAAEIDRPCHYWADLRIADGDFLEQAGGFPPKTPGPIPIKDEEPESPPRQDYVGEVKNGLYHGQSTLTFDAEDKYVGQFEDGMYHGE